MDQLPPRKDMPTLAKLKQGEQLSTLTPTASTYAADAVSRPSIGLNDQSGRLGTLIDLTEPSSSSLSAYQRIQLRGKMPSVLPPPAPPASAATPTQQNTQQTAKSAAPRKALD